MPETEEEISRRPDVREELDRTAPRELFLFSLSWPATESL